MSSMTLRGGTRLDVITMTPAMRLKEKYRHPGIAKHVGAQNHNGTTARRKRRTIDTRKGTGTGRDRYR